MDLIPGIRERVVPLTIIAVIIACGFIVSRKVPAGGNAGITGIAAWIVLVALFGIVLAAFPVAAIICGWYTGNRTGAVLAGALPFPLGVATVLVLLRSHAMIWFPLPGSVLYLGIVSVIGGLAGFCAAQKTKPYLALAVVLAGTWIFWMLNAIH